VIRTGWKHGCKDNRVCIELWEARSMYQAMRGPRMGGRAPGAGLTGIVHLKRRRGKEASACCTWFL
jgi:hypothetical protein